ncbi:MAG: hypothetical protein U1E05_17365 [Patescibacteria group bacterium]|nr:hypothetical protein [Patescibacteria group bacterium]
MRLAASVGTVVLTSLFAGTVVHSAPPPPQEERDRVEDAAEAAALRKAFKEADVPIRFYAKVVDNDGNPLEGASVTIGVTHYDPDAELLTGDRTTVLMTKADGTFSVENQRGRSLGVITVMKEGFEFVRAGGQQEFQYQPVYVNHYIPDPNNPVVFRMRKIGKTAFLLEPLMRKTQSFRVRPDGQAVMGVASLEFRSYHPNAVDLLPGFAVAGRVSDVNRDWVFTFTGKREGDTVLLLDQMPYRAPEVGYEPSAEFRVPLRNGPSPEPYPRGVEVFLVVRTRDPEVFLRVNVRMSPKDDNCIVYYNMTINPYGGRSFEAAELGKYMEPRETLRREAVQALCAGRLPPEPDIPALIRKAENAKQ